MGVRRGWWGNSVSPEGETEEEFGSWLWLLENEVATDAVAFQAKGYAEAALAWMVRDRVASRVTVETGLLAQNNGIFLRIAIFDRGGAQAYDRRFERAWRQINT